MKGVILGVNSKASIVDITHFIEPQNIVQAGWAVTNVFPYFPKGTIHVIVVDPGVGTGRRIIALQTADQIFLAPDNGVLTMLLDGIQDCRVYEITNSHFFLKETSNTFHGRDIFAPVAGYLSIGTNLKEMGQLIAPEDLIRLAIQRPSFDDHGTLWGTVIAIDHFGNLITNIDKSMFDSTYAEDIREQLRLRINGRVIQGISLNYMAVALHKPLVLFGSNGFLEISIRSGSASACLQAQTGDTVLIELPSEG